MIAISSTLILKPSMYQFEFRFRRKLAKGRSSVTKEIRSLSKAVIRSKSRSAICFYSFLGHVNFTTRIRATTAEEKKRTDFAFMTPSTGVLLPATEFPSPLHAPPLIPPDGSALFKFRSLNFALFIKNNHNTTKAIDHILDGWKKKSLG